MVHGSTCFGSQGNNSSWQDSFPKLIGHGTGITEVMKIDVANDGRVVAVVKSDETELLGNDTPTSKMVVMYDPDSDEYLWSKIIQNTLNESDMWYPKQADVHFAFSDHRVLVNWVQWASGNTRRARRARQLKSEGDTECDYEEKKRERRRRQRVSSC